MRVSSTVGLIAFCGLFNVNAALRASLSIGYCSWNASDILVLSLAPEKGKFAVVEAIKGDTPAGTLLTSEELTPPDGDATSLANVDVASRRAPGPIAVIS